MKAKKIYYSIVVGLQSLLILLLLVNVGYCLVTSDLTMFPTTALYLNFYPFINFCQTHNPYDLLVFISLMILILVMHFATIYILFKKVKRIYAWVVIVNAYMYALTLYSNGDLIYVLKGGAYLIYGYSNVAMFCLLCIFFDNKVLRFVAGELFVFVLYCVRYSVDFYIRIFIS